LIFQAQSGIDEGIFFQRSRRGMAMGLFRIFGVLSPAHMIWARLSSGARKVGTDQYGNRYYRARPRRGYKKERRWVIYRGAPEASSVPPEWHGWLHHQTDIVPDNRNPSFRRTWQKPHRANLTGTKQAYRPPGHLLAGGNRAPATGDYEAWSPDPHASPVERHFQTPSSNA
jgi:NADH:ubiquinone oxidoreductase subunit